MKTILVDAVNTLIVDKTIDQEIFNLLETYQNSKIILSNANDSEIIEFGLQNLPYKFFTRKHNPNKTDSEYYRIFLDEFKLAPGDVVYFEHNIDAAKSAESIGIKTFHFDKNLRDLAVLKNFLDNNL